jgi:hypothetical protein
MRKTCLVVRGELTGNIENLDAVFLELDEGECPGCPFRPDRRLGFDLPSPYVTREGNIFTANFCGLDGDAVYRWRLVGRNVFDIHEEAKSEVQTTAPTP